MIGERLLHYRILETLGRGGMGTVYLAEDTKLGRRVALKLLPEHNYHDREWRERFEREARAVAALSHPNIVTLFATEQEGERHFLTMELVEGEPLGARIPKGGLGLEAFLDIAIPLADALHAAHEAGVLHRDLKPANVMIDRHGGPKVLDFGLARIDSVGETALSPDDTPTRALTDAVTSPGQVMGTTPYMSPEQAKGQIVDRRSDLFALGAVYYQMLTGRRAFDGESMVETVSAVLRDDPEPVHEVKAELPRHLGRIVRHCLEKDPEKRFQSAADVRNELETLREEIVSGQHGPTEDQAGARPKKRRRWLPVGIAVAVLLAVAGAWFVATRSTDEPEPTSTSAAATGDRRSLAVLYFENRSGDPELDWLESGLPDVLVTELAQAKGLSVLGTDHVYRLMGDLDRSEETDEELARRFAETAGVDTLVLGSVLRAGEQIRINVQIQEARTGTVLGGLSRDGVGQESLFDMADQLGREVRDLLGVEIPLELGGDRPLAEVTTDSIEALKEYTQALQLRREFFNQEALAHLRRAVELDPGFAAAWVSLSVVADNIGRVEEANHALEEAYTYKHRLPLIERLRFEASYSSRSFATRAQAEEAIRKVFDIDPSFPASRNLVFGLHNMERFAEAERPLETLLGLEPVNPMALADAAIVYGGLDRPGEIEPMLLSFRSKDPKSWLAAVALGEVYLMTSRLPEAETQLRDALRLGEEEGSFALWDWMDFLVVSERWEDLESEAARFETSSHDGEVQMASWLQSRFLEYRGQTQEIVELFEDEVLPALEEEPATRDSRASRFAYVHLLRGEPAKALPYFRRAATAEHSMAFYQLQTLRLNGIYGKTLAEVQLGEQKEADRTIEAFERLFEPIPGQLHERVLLQLRGEVAVERGDAAGAVDLLEKAEQLLPPGDYPSTMAFQRFRLWEVKARAHLAAGQLREAAAYLERMVHSGYERRFDVALWVQAHYRLAEAYEQLGRNEEAREYYGRFYEMWKDADILEDWVKTSRSKM